jgi:hypothetical protein
VSRYPSEWDAEWAIDLDAWQLYRLSDTVADFLGVYEQRLVERAAWVVALSRHEIPYDEYLRSDWWQYIRVVALEAAGWRCEYRQWQRTGRRCKATEHLDVHHLTYDHLGDEPLEDLIVLCRRHHTYVHREYLR